MDNFTEEELGLLRNSMLLSKISEDMFTAFIALSHKLSYAPDEVILREGECSDHLYIIISGSVDLFKSGKNEEQEKIATLHAGQSIGEMRIVTSRPCTLTVVARESVIVLSTLLTDLRAPENRLCYDSILDSIISVLNDRLSSGNVMVMENITEKRTKTKQLMFALLMILTLGLLLTEAGFAMYYLTHTADFCNDMKTYTTGATTEKTPAGW